MGLIVSVYRDKRLGDCTNGGASSKHDELTLVNVDGPFEPQPHRPAALLVKGASRGIARIVMQDDHDAKRWTMMGGNYAATSDSRFTKAVEAITGAPFYGAVAIHDRVE